MLVSKVHSLIVLLDELKKRRDVVFGIAIIIWTACDCSGWVDVGIVCSSLGAVSLFICSSLVARSLLLCSSSIITSLFISS